MLHREAREDIEEVEVREKGEVRDESLCDVAGVEQKGGRSLGISFPVSVTAAATVICSYISRRLHKSGDWMVRG